jgi:hypothetical protein
LTAVQSTVMSAHQRRTPRAAPQRHRSAEQPGLSKITEHVYEIKTVQWQMTTISHETTIPAHLTENIANHSGNNPWRNTMKETQDITHWSMNIESIQNSNLSINWSKKLRLCWPHQMNNESRTRSEF